MAITLPLDAIRSLSAVSDALSLATVLRLSFDWDWHSNSARQVHSWQAPQALRDYGRLVLDYDARWLTQRADALALGARLLQFRARPQLQISCDVPAALAGQIRLGTVIDWAHPHTPSGELLIDNLEVRGPSLRLEGALAIGPVPAVELLSSAEAFGPIVPEGLGVSFDQGLASFTLIIDGQPAPGAQITIAGKQFTTDSNGQAAITGLEHGDYEALVITATGQRLTTVIRI